MGYGFDLSFERRKKLRTLKHHLGNGSWEALSYKLQDQLEKKDREILILEDKVEELTEKLLKFLEEKESIEELNKDRLARWAALDKEKK